MAEAGANVALASCIAVARDTCRVARELGRGTRTMHENFERRVDAIVDALLSRVHYVVLDLRRVSLLREQQADPNTGREWKSHARKALLA